MSVVVLNAFSINMLVKASHEVMFTPVTIEEAKALLVSGFSSCVGHPDTARVFSSLLGAEVAMNRTSYSFKSEDVLLVGQYTGPRLPEGASQLPEGATITWWKVNHK